MPNIRAAAPDVVATGVSKAFDGVPVLVDADLHVAAGSVVALLGPSGCGKTTLLRILAGLEEPDAGTVKVGESVLVGPGTFVPPERRRVGLVFQDWALFPHLTVENNVGYGVPRGPERAQRVQSALDLVGLGTLGDRMPGTLSGGQQQRVALARAVASEPAVLLLDEPFSNLDTTLRTQVRGEIHELLVSLGITTVVVTHDQEEAFVLGDQVALLNGGRIVQQGTPAEIYERPADRWVADFVGDANLLAAIAEGATARSALGVISLREPAHGLIDLLIRPEELTVSPAQPADAPGPAATAAVSGERATVELVEFYGHDTVLLVSLPDATRLRVRCAGAPLAGRGDEVRVTYRGGPVMAFGSDAVTHDVTASVAAPVATSV